MLRQHRRAPARLCREYAFFLALALSGAFMYGVSIYLRSLFRNDAIMQLPTCAARFEALGMPLLQDEPSGSAPKEASEYILRRHAVYTNMGQDVLKKGLSVGGVITQGLTQDDLFEFKRAQPDKHVGFRSLKGRGLPTYQPGALRIEPVLHALDVPVRAMILPMLDLSIATQISAAVRQLLLPVLSEGSIWLQDDHLYHATVFHASSHMHPVPAAPDVVEAEARSIASVASSSCPIEAVLERVVLTSSGVMVACWQATAAGTEPAQLRAQLQRALPNAPPHEFQMVKEPSILHTTIARLLRPPRHLGASSTGNTIDGLRGDEARGVLRPTNNTLSGSKGAVAGAGETEERGGIEGGFSEAKVVDAVDAVSKVLCGIRVHFSELWFVEEMDLLALALRGRFATHQMPLQCSKFH